VSHAHLRVVRDARDNPVDTLSLFHWRFIVIRSNYAEDGGYSGFSPFVARYCMISELCLAKSRYLRIKSLYITKFRLCRRFDRRARFPKYLELHTQS